MTDSARRSARVVLVGAGHAHLHLLREGERFARRGLELLLVEPDAFCYSGLATGVLAGMYEPAMDRVDPAPLARRAGARIVRDRVVGADPGRRVLELESGRRLPFDLLSLNVGSEVDAEGLAGAAAHAWPVKPIPSLWRLREAVERRLGEPGAGRARAVVVGGGATGCETAACLDALGRRGGGRRLRVTLVSRSRRILPAGPAGAADRLLRHLEGRGIEVRAGVAAARVDEEGVTLEDGARLESEFTVAATGLRAPRWLAGLGLPVDGSGALRVGPGLETAPGSGLFGAGDCIALEGHDLPRLGVFAVRQAPVLLANLLAAAAGGGREAYEPQSRWLTILNLGPGRGLATWGPLWWLGRASLWLKDRIDRRFLERHRPGGSG